MGQLVVTEFVSLDGVFEDPGGAERFEHGGWTFTFDRGADGGTFKLDELMAAEAQLFGRVTYEGFAAAWPSRTDDVGFADRINGLPKYVVSKTLTSADWAGSTIIRDHVAEEVTALKQRYDGDILVAGSGQLVQYLLSAGLVDRLQLMTFPIVLGSGRRLFAAGAAPIRFALIESRPVGPDGVTIQIYAAASAR